MTAFISCDHHTTTVSGASRESGLINEQGAAVQKPQRRAAFWRVCARMYQG